MKLYTNHTDYWIAEHANDLRALVIECYGDSDETTEILNDGFSEVPDDKAITIHNYEGKDQAVTLTAKEWIAKEGRGLLASTEY